MKHILKRLVSVVVGFLAARFAFYKIFEMMPNRDGLAPAIFALAGAIGTFVLVTALIAFAFSLPRYLSDDKSPKS